MILVFAGAGASKAVDPNYPTTREFFERLPNGITNSSVFENVCAFIRKWSARDVIDIEEWLWEARKARELFENVNDPQHAAGWLLAGRSRPVFTEDHERGARDGCRNLANSLSRLESDINQLVYRLYGAEPEEDSLKRTWLPLLEMLKRRNERFEVFTTNYDLVLEEANRLAERPMETGRLGTQYTRLNELAWSARDPQGKRGRLTKLHGSVDWIRDDGRIFCGQRRFTGNHEDHVIIYPGYKGRPVTPPFDAFHEHFRASVSAADLLVFIGFAFRDDYINEVLQRNMKSQAVAVIVDIAPSHPNVPFARERYHYIAEGFNETTAAYIEEALKAGPDFFQAIKAGLDSQQPDQVSA